MENGDDWFAPDKFQHVLFCFSIAIFFALIASQSRYSFLRRRCISVGSIFSFAAGAAKEVADELGFFSSAGASAKDATADLLGILLAVLALTASKSLFVRFKPDRPAQDLGLEMV